MKCTPGMEEFAGGVGPLDLHAEPANAVPAWKCHRPIAWPEPPWTCRDTVALVAEVVGCPQRSARAWLRAAGSLRSLAGEPLDAGGPTPRQRQRLLGALELARRAVLEGRVAMPLDEPSALVAWFRDLAMAATPQIGLAGLDGAGRLVVEQRLSGALRWQGPGPLLRPVLAAGATTLSVVAVVPAGAPLLRPDDAAFAQRLASASTLCEVRLADVVLLGDGRWLSLRQLGHLQEETLP